MEYQRDGKLGHKVFLADCRILQIVVRCSQDLVGSELYLGISQTQEEKRRDYPDEQRGWLAKEGKWVGRNSKAAAVHHCAALGQQRRWPMFAASFPYLIRGVFARKT